MLVDLTVRFTKHFLSENSPREDRDSGRSQIATSSYTNQFLSHQCCARPKRVTKVLQVVSAHGGNLRISALPSGKIVNLMSLLAFSETQKYDQPRLFTINDGWCLNDGWWLLFTIIHDGWWWLMILYNFHVWQISVVLADADSTIDIWWAWKGMAVDVDSLHVWTKTLSFSLSNILILTLFEFKGRQHPATAQVQRLGPVIAAAGPSTRRKSQSDVATDVDSWVV